MIRFIDCVSFYKKKMVTKGLREPEKIPKKIYINKVKICQNRRDLPLYKNLPPPQINMNTREQNLRPAKICALVRTATKLLYRIYKDDPRFIIHEDEEERLNINQEDPDTRLACCSTHLPEEINLQKDAKMRKHIGVFYDDLFDPRHDKVALEKQAANLIKIIMNEGQDEFKHLRKIIKNTDWKLYKDKDIHF